MDIAQIIQSISIFLACWAVIAALDAWKREFIGKRKIELAEKVLAKFYEINDSISYIRNPFSFINEGSTREKSQFEREEETKILNRAYIIFERYQKKKDVFLQFNILKYEFMASFGKETIEIFDKTNKVLNKIFLSAEMLGTYYWKRQGRVPMSDEEFKKHLNEMHKHEGIFWSDFSEEDEIKKELNEILIILEGITKPCFEEISSLYSIFTKKIFKKRGNNK